MKFKSYFGLVRPFDPQIDLTQFVKDHMPNALLTLDNTYTIRTCTAAAERIFGYTSKQLIGQPISILLPDWSTEWIGAAEQTTTATHQDGSTRSVACELHRLNIELPTDYLILSVRETAVLKPFERMLKLASAVFDSTQEGVILTDESVKILYVNPAFTTATGYTAEEAVGRNPRMLQSGWHNNAFYEKMWSSLNETGMWQGEIWNRRKNGAIYPQWLTIRSLLNDQGVVVNYTAVFDDITERKKEEERLYHQTHHDALTGLPNRVMFMERLTQAMADAKRLGLLAGVMFLDLDRFKLINDTMGHNTGDVLLQYVAERLVDCVRDGDTVARLGGDEFTILLEKLDDPTEASAVADKILSAFDQSFSLNGQEFFVTPSIGVALYPHDGDDVESLIKNADTALYRAKEHGNNYQIYTAAMSGQSSMIFELEKDLRKALERDEIIVHYQPQVSLSSGKMVGMEALVRWQHPTRGLVSPAQFIPLAEETGLIVPIGEYVLRTACKQNKLWQEKGYPPMRLAVNLSARQFQQKDLTTFIRDVLQETGLDARYLELEITESLAMDDVHQAISILHSLKELGVQISIDDFGTGYSSLSYLKKFPIQTLKIDRSFVNDISHDPDDAAIASSIIVMAHSLKLNVIAEGVETASQLNFLRDRNCNEMQGYLFSKPLSAEAFEEMLASGISLSE